MLSRGACALEHNLGSIRRKPPYLLFGLLGNPSQAAEVAEQLTQLKPCQMDTITKWFLDAYPTAEQLNSPESLAICHAIAAMTSVDVTEVECRHASIRRLLDLKQLTWDSLLEAISADFLVRQAATCKAAEAEALARMAFYRQRKPPNSESKCSFKQSQKEEQRKAKQLARAGKRAKAKASAAAGRKAAGKKRINPPRAGAQRAYFHARLSKQDWGNRRALFQRLGREFKSLPKEQMQKFQDHGRAGRDSSRAGAASFLKQSNWVRSSRQRLQETSSQDLTVAVIPVADAVSADQAELTGLVAKASDLQKLARDNASQLARRQEDIDDVRHAQVASFVAVDLEGSSKLALPKDLFELSISRSPRRYCYVREADGFPTAKWLNPAVHVAEAMAPVVFKVTTALLDSVA